MPDRIASATVQRNWNPVDPGPRASVILTVVFLLALLACAALYGSYQATMRSGVKLTQSFGQVIEEQTNRTLQVIDQQLASAGLRLDYFKVYLDHPDTVFDVGSPVSSRMLGTWLISAARPMPKNSEAFSDVIVAAFMPTYFDRTWRDFARDTGSVVALFHRNGTLLALSPPDDASIGKNFAGQPLPSQGLALQDSGALSAFDGKTGLVRDGDEGLLVVCDDGCCFEIDRSLTDSSSNASSRMGIASMGERAALIGGHLELTS